MERTKITIKEFLLIVCRSFKEGFINLFTKYKRVVIEIAERNGKYWIIFNNRCLDSTLTEDRDKIKRQFDALKTYYESPDPKIIERFEV